SPGRRRRAGPPGGRRGGRARNRSCHWQVGSGRLSTGKIQGGPPMSDASMRMAGILLVVYPTVVGGGVSILTLWLRRSPYYDHPLRPRMWAAGHAHAGVLLLLSLAALLLVDHA